MSSFEIHLPKQDTVDHNSNNLDNARFDAFSNHPAVIEVAAKTGGSPTNSASNSSRDTDTFEPKVTTTVEPKFTNTVDPKITDTNTNRVTIDNTVKTGSVGTIAGIAGIAGLVAGSAAGAHHGRSGERASSGCIPFSIGAHAFVFGADMTAPNTACVEHPQNLRFGLDAAAQAVTTMDHAGEVAKRAVEEGPTSKGKIDLTVANTDAGISNSLAAASTTAIAHEFPTPPTQSAQPVFSAELLNGNSPR